MASPVTEARQVLSSAKAAAANVVAAFGKGDSVLAGISAADKAIAAIDSVSNAKVNQSRPGFSVIGDVPIQTGSSKPSP